MSVNVNYDDKRFAEVEADKKAALNEVDKTYGDMINESDSYYKAQIDASKQWADTQTKLQNEKTDFAIEQIEQQKDQTKKDYLKEQSGAYVDWRKQSNEYGAKSEEMAAKGLDNTGYSESSQVSMYNTYQNRVATARESYSKAILNYDNAIKDARLQNNSVLAEIAYKALQEQLELSLEGFQYKNTLVLEKANKRTEVENNYYNRYQDVLSQINTENALSEQIRQFNEQMALEKEQFAWQKEQAEAKSSGSGGGGGSRSSGSSTRFKNKSYLNKGSTDSGKKITNEKAIKNDNSTKKNNNRTGKVTIDKQSVLNLGGPYNGQTLAKMEEDGIIKSTTKNNKITFNKRGKASKYLKLTGF